VRLPTHPAVRAFDGRMIRTADNATVSAVIKWIVFNDCIVDGQLRLPVTEIEGQLLCTIGLVSCSLAG
jgi:hypothetical protein